MVQNGIVKQIIKNMAEVEIQRSSACGESCASCGLCPGQLTVVSALNDADAKIGDSVIIDMSDKKVLGAALLVYIVPVLMLFGGYFAGYAIFGGETAAVAAGFTVMAAAFMIIILFDKRLRAKYTPRIVRIEGKSDDRI